jgi:hypothetical protein
VGLQDFRWFENVMLGEHQTNVILSGEITAEAATLNAYITNFSNLSPEPVATLVNRVGRERHLIEDTFNTQKNNGIGLEHFLCAHATASKNYYIMMQVAQILWILTCRGCLQRLYDWARRATEQGLARAVWEGLCSLRMPHILPHAGLGGLVARVRLRNSNDDQNHTRPEYQKSQHPKADRVWIGVFGHPAMPTE